MTHNTLIRWNPSEYGASKFSGAKKLSDSHVAPLVAQARGYETINDADTAKQMVLDKVRTDNPLQATKRLRAMVVGDEDFLVLPWHRIDRVLTDGINVSPTSIQVRPSVPVPMKGAKKPPKYETLGGHASVLDLHPAVSADWFESSRTILITEGVLKGDSALTAQLLNAGYTTDDLGVVGGVKEAREKIAELLDTIDPALRVPVMCFIGVANWHQNPEWNAINIREKKALVAFDGDLRENRQVWNQATRLFDMLTDLRHARPALLDLGGVEAEMFAMNSGYHSESDNPKNRPKIGLDDFLANVGGTQGGSAWADVLKLEKSSLPPAPAGTVEEELQPGAWRVAEDGLSSERLVENRHTGNVTWQPGIDMGGRIKEISSRLMPADVDTEEGTISEKNHDADTDGQVVIELSWADPSTGETVVRNIVGPLDLLDASPAEWGRRGATISPDIRRHPHWPPRNKEAEGWITAIKSHRIEDQHVTEGWDTMGWVPSANTGPADGHPAFIVGNQVLGISREHEATHTPAVTQERLPGAERYGVNDQYHQYMDRDDLDGYKNHVAESIREAVEAFVVDSPWTSEGDRAYGPILLAGALRPACPRKGKLLFDFIGEPGSGKSWVASFVMGFWQPAAGRWSAQNLPGAAMDTFAAIEHSLARTPIWVIDDLAPSASRQIAEQQEAAMDQITRAAFNGAPKRRSNADGTQRTVSVPRALTILTAENQRSTKSIRERVIELEFAKNRISDKRGKAIEALTKDARNPLAALTAAVIRFWLHTGDIAETSLPFARSSVMEHFDDETDFTRWEKKNELAYWLVDGAKRDIQDVLTAMYGIPASTAARRAGVYAELIFVLDTVRALAEWAGIAEDDKVMRAISGDLDDPKTAQGRMIELAARTIQGLESRSNARSIVDGIRELLQTGAAHFENPTQPGAAPIPHTYQNAQKLNRELGWTLDPMTDKWKPMGTPIGYAGYPTTANGHEDWIALVHPTRAFDLAKRFAAGTIPAGQKHRDTWNQVWEAEQGLFVAVYSRPKTGDIQVRARFRAGDENRMRGVPMRLSLFLDGGVDSLIETREATKVDTEK